MTRDEILALKPGPEMNALVDEKVMGKQKVYVSDWSGVVYTEADSPYPTSSSYMTDTSSYSIDWGAAGQVVDMMDEGGYWLELKSPFYEGRPWFAGFTPHHTTGWNGIPDNQAPGKAAPEAVCKAALLATLEAE